MSVPLNKRSESRVEFLHTLFKLQKELTLLFIRDFGAKPVTRKLKSFVHSAKMAEEDRIAYMALCEKYHIDVEAEWPLWLIEHYRTKLLAIMESLETNVVTANTI